jgi:excisionase family DNA binding protein
VRLLPRGRERHGGRLKRRDVQPISGSRYADVWQAAEYLHVSVACIRKWLSLKKLARYRVGRRVLVRISDLDALVVADSPAEGEAA